MSKVIVVFGEMGIGKNFVGELIAQHLQVPFIDGDNFLPTAMANKVKRFLPLTPKEIEIFVKDYMTMGMIDLLQVQDKPGMVLAQALYIQDHRDFVAKALERLGLEYEFVYVSAGSLLTHLSRLWSRPRGWLWALYGLINKPFFQKPSRSELVFVNNGTREELVAKIKRIF